MDISQYAHRYATNKVIEEGPNVFGQKTDIDTAIDFWQQFYIDLSTVYIETGTKEVQ